MANNPEILWNEARENALDVSGSKLFYYSAYERELVSDGWTFDPKKWRPMSRATSSEVRDDVVVPKEDTSLILLGYDVVVFGDFLEHSPLSCNSIATNVGVNRFCLFDGIDEAKSAIDAGKFGGGCEEGAYKIFSVSELLHPSS